MFTCDQIWLAIERLAETKGVSMSRLAIIAGLDSTALNLSKRIKPDGTARWPSTGSLAKILAATNTSLTEFAELVDGKARPSLDMSGDKEPRATILLVEDDETLGAISADILRHAGYRVYFASDHNVALELLAGTEPIHLLLTDIVMPAGLGGVALARIAQMRRPGIKIVYSTAYDIPGLSASSGGDIVLHKPVDSDRLLATIERLIEPTGMRVQ